MGSNLGDRRAILREAISSLSAVVAVSPVYETDPVGGPSGQGPFLNLVVEIDTELTARQLLGVCHRLESAANRVRTERWGPRTLDVDIVWMEAGSVNEPDLQVPHARMYERRFVMAPLADLAPDLVPDDWNERAEGHVHQVEPL
jgi:2-amino-4-hydroxy-6-hydroxymethyldihydropteridine diphosphokinase